MLTGHEHVAVAMLTGQEQWALRTVAIVMRSCADSLADHSRVGHQLAEESGRLLALLDRRARPALALVAPPPPPH